ncbi:RNase L inhibitor [Sulfolobus sp. S-194]|uniref:RNase L inhibitor n=1 Tax=Sulfolobus sp. S-194 TaxID=2512240 RepID=UPI0014372225|nr:RNase L inhibitor [Sulfolobus sp. S-194]QIW23902.1 RNase L inhibitor [Sulfolobus sp. S-194]
MSDFLFRFLGVDKIVKNIEEETRKIIYPIKISRDDSLSILKEILKEYNINIELKESGSLIDERRRLTSIASNMTPLNVENPEDILWQIAQAIKPKGLRKCQKSDQ